MTGFRSAPPRTIRKKKIASRETRRLADAPEWIELRTIILSTLEPFPDALAAIMAALPEHPE